VAGIASLGFQFLMVDVNPQQPQGTALPGLTVEKPSAAEQQENAKSQRQLMRIFKDANFLKFLLYFGAWTFAVNLSAPFFNLYLLDNLALDLSWVTLYTSLASGANLVMLLLWGKLADRLGNRPLLILVGILVAVTPFFWLGAGNDAISLWLGIPLLHILTGGTWAAIDLCNNNIQMEVAPVDRPSTYFAIAAAVSGVCGAVGTTAGGIIVSCLTLAACLDYLRFRLVSVCLPCCLSFLSESIEVSQLFT
jgi:predicted MFS family arabinose efflux permease